ncbi:unnamed protein product [Timema podura]|uniref:C2 domain-containing protein n=1 Tax=Timema podura TaxID=61482 RepID=A0ABN7PIP8_TIMPD|nr:unnamed protein product [Timema podura]
MSAEDMSTGTGQLDYQQCWLLVKDVVSRQRMGVVFAYIHGAEGLMSGEQGDCNPYCMLFKKGTKVKTTHYLRGTSSPQWESQVQFLVRDYTKVALSFVVCSWSPNRMSDARLLGLASFNMALGETRVVRRVLPLNGSGHASVTVSLVFHPVQSVSQSEPTPCQEESKEDDTCRFPREKRNSNSWVQQAKQLLNNKEQDACISSLLSAGQGLMEVTLLRAHDLVSKDMNGFSDPYCELKVGDERKYKSSVKKKTLNPCWDESAIMGLPCNGGLLEVYMKSSYCSVLLSYPASLDIEFTVNTTTLHTIIDSLGCLYDGVTTPKGISTHHQLLTRPPLWGHMMHHLLCRCGSRPFGTCWFTVLTAAVEPRPPVTFIFLSQLTIQQVSTGCRHKGMGM